MIASLSQKIATSISLHAVYIQLQLLSMRDQKRVVLEIGESITLIYTILIVCPMKEPGVCKQTFSQPQTNSAAKSEEIFSAVKPFGAARFEICMRGITTIACNN